MALPAGMIPYGLRQVMLAPLGAVDLIGTKVAFPNSRTFSFTDGTDSVELRGDDKQVANRDTGTAVEHHVGHAARAARDHRHASGLRFE